MRSGRRVVSEWLAPLCSCSGATTQTSSDRSWAIVSSTLMPGEAMPSSLEIRIRHLASSMCRLAIVPNHFLTAHVGLQRLGDRNRAVMALEVLDDRDHRAADREGGAVEGMHRARALASRRPIARLHPLGLERTAIRAARDLTIGVLAGEPDLDVVGLARGEPHVAGRQEHDAVGEAEPLQHLFGALGHALVLGL